MEPSITDLLNKTMVRVEQTTDAHGAYAVGLSGAPFPYDASAEDDTADIADAASRAFWLDRAKCGLLRGEVACVVDPASGTIDALTDAVYVVIAAGTYSVLGSIADAADGTNTIRLDNTTPVRARVVETEETLTLGAYTGRCVKLKINQTNCP